MLCIFINSIYNECVGVVTLMCWRLYHVINGNDRNIVISFNSYYKVFKITDIHKTHIINKCFIHINTHT